MRVKRKKDRASRVKPREKDNIEFLNKPFDSLVKDIKDLYRSAEPVSTISMPDDEREESDDALFQRAMKGVQPLKGNKDKIINTIRVDIAAGMHKIPS